MATEARVVEGDGGGVTTLLRAALPGVPGVNLLPGIRKTTADLDGLVFTRPAVEVRRDHVDAYARVCGFPIKDTVPLSYLHVLGFPLHLRVMTDPAFPFPAIGTVHLSNVITGHRPVAVGETVAVTVHPERLQPHAKGQTVDFVTEVTSDGDLVWEGRSTYLRRGRGSADAPSAPVFDDVAGPGVTWPLEGDLGRRYAAVSGDHNPIHLYPLTAKALGFRAADRARDVVEGALRRGTGEPAARRGDRRGGVQEADLPARQGRIRLQADRHRLRLRADQPEGRRRRTCSAGPPGASQPRGVP